MRCVRFLACAGAFALGAQRFCARCAAWHFALGAQRFCARSADLALRSERKLGIAFEAQTWHCARSADLVICARSANLALRSKRRLGDLRSKRRLGIALGAQVILRSARTRIWFSANSCAKSLRNRDLYNKKITCAHKYKVCEHIGPTIISALNEPAWACAGFAHSTLRKNIKGARKRI